MRVTASRSSGSAPGRGWLKTAPTLTVRAGSSRQARWAWAWEGVSTLASPIRSPPASESSKESQTRTATTGPARLAAHHQRVVGRADEHGRRIEEPRPVQGLAAGQQLGARVDRVLHLPVHPHAVVVVDQRPDVGPGLEARADPQRAGAGDQRVEERLRDGAVHVHPLDRPARLPGAHERARRDLRAPRTRRRRRRRRSPDARTRPPRPGGSRDRRPGGSPAAARRARRRAAAAARRPGRAARRPSRAASGAFSDGLRTTQLPVTSDAASALHEAASGSHHGIRIATTPRGSRITRSPRGGRARSSGPSSA